MLDNYSVAAAFEDHPLLLQRVQSRRVLQFHGQIAIVGSLVEDGFVVETVRSRFLATILGILQLLLSKELSPAQRRKANTIVFALLNPEPRLFENSVEEPAYLISSKQ